MKNNAVIRIVLWSITALVLTGILVGVLALRDYGLVSWSFMGRYNDADSYTVGDASIEEPVNRLRIDWVSGAIDIAAYDGETVEISETGAADEDEQLRYRVKDGELMIHHQKSRWFFGVSLKTRSKSLTVKIPRDYLESFRSVKIDSTSAKITITELIASEKIEIDNVSGAAELTDIKTALLDCDTVSGDFTASGEITELDYNSTSGDANITTSVPMRKLEIDTVSGNVTVSIPENNGFTLEFDTVSGDFTATDFPTIQRDDKRIFGDGSADFEADSVSGDFTVKKYQVLLD